MTESPEQYFFKYAFPAAKSCRVSPDKIKDLENILISGKAPTRQELEKLFPVAVQRLKALRNNQDYWSFENVKDYWLSNHNQIVENKVCHIFLAEVISVEPMNKGIQYARIKLNGNEISSKSYEKINSGDKVSCHFLQIIEKLPSEDIEKYFKLK